MKPSDTEKTPSTPSSPSNSKGKNTRDDDDAAPMAQTAKPGLLPTGLSRAIVLAAVIIASTVATTGLLAGRFALVSSGRTENALMYRIDRLTGRVSLCTQSQCTTLANRPETGG